MNAIKYAGVFTLLILLAGCSLYRNDRQFVWDIEYHDVRQLYDRCGSVDIVEDVLRDYKWSQGKINEVMYRLNQDYWLDEDGIPRGIDRPEPVVSSSRLASEIPVGTSRWDSDREYEDRRWERGY
jgi:hypothetical protein